MHKHRLAKVIWSLFVIVSHAWFQANGNTTKFTEQVCETHFKHGDIIIGGMFYMHNSVNAPCDGGINEYAISFVESMTYAVELINKRNDILPNVSLGYEIRNYCGDEDIATWTMLTMTSPSGNADYADTCPNYFRGKADKVLAVIGPESSSTSLLAAKIGRVYAVPIISYFATSDELSNADRFPFFFRVVPPDRFQVGAIIDLLLFYEWKYIALFYSIDSYGIHGARQIQTMAEKRDICLAINMPVSGESSDSEIKEIGDKLKESDKVSVIVIFAVTLSAKSVLRATQDIDRHFTFIGSDGWGPDAHDFDDLGSGALFVRFSSVSASSFQDYYKHLPSNTEGTSSWYRTYLHEINGLTSNCTAGKCLIPKPHDVTEQIIDGVLAIGYALESIRRIQANTCKYNGSCNDTFNGWDIKENLYRVSFTRPSSPKLFKFDTNGEVSSKYELQNWQLKDGVHELVTVGLWDPDDAVFPLRLSEELIQWSTTGKTPRSLCVEDCKPGYIRVPLKKKCCLGCQRCLDHAIVTVDNQTSTATCLECPTTHWPDVNFTKCSKIKPSYVDFDSMVFILSATGAGIGLILTGIAGIGIWYYSDHSLIKASSRELSCINIIGLAFSCVVVVLILFRPTEPICIIVDVCISTCVCMTFVPMLLKVNRIWRIFNATKGKRPRYTSPGHQLAIASVFIIIEVLIACSCIYFAASKPTILFPLQRKPYLEIYCQFSYGFLATCVYNMSIIIACCYYAFRARKVPSNYNESKFIAISVYSTVIVCLAAVPVYSTAIDVAQKILTLIIALLFNTFLTLACLYLPKIYAIHFAGEDEQQSWRTHGSTMNASVYEKPAGTEMTATPIGTEKC